MCARKTPRSLREENWIEEVQKGKKYEAQFRYHGERIPAIPTDEGIKIEYDGNLPLGQSLVLYEGPRLIGGGIIDKVV